MTIINRQDLCRIQKTNISRSYKRFVEHNDGVLKAGMRSKLSELVHETGYLSEAASAHDSAEGI